MKKSCIFCFLFIWTLIVSCIVSVIWYFLYAKPSETSKERNNLNLNIPDSFLLGAATSAFQAEGAWNISGKSESFVEWIMHRLTNESSATADISSDSYHNYKEDVKVLKYVGLNLYRFSISWPRLLPTGYTNVVNNDGVRYYHALLDELEKNGVQPFVLLHHFDHPVVLEETGGWTNESMIQAFSDYARFVFKEFGHRIKLFVTFNEPNVFCLRVYPAYWSIQISDKSEYLNESYLCGHNILKAHAEVYHLYNKEFRSQQNGKIGINFGCSNFFSKFENDFTSSELAFQFGCGYTAHPIFSKSGDYSKIMKQVVLENSQLEGFSKSRLPTFSDKEINYIKGSADFLAISHYQSHLVEPVTKDKATIWRNQSISSDAGLILSDDPRWTTAPNGFKIVPHGLRHILRKIKQEYDNPDVYIAENGYADFGNIDDAERIKFLYSFMKEILDAINYDNCSIKSYIYWSLIDSYEFEDNFNVHFGLARIDFKHPNRTRILRKSATWLRNVIKMKKLYIDQ